MPYTKFENNVPIIADDGSEVIDDTRNNFEALRDALITGALPDWPLNEVNGTADAPSSLVWKNGVLWLRCSLTWGTTGGPDGNPTVLVYDFSGDSGGGWDAIGTNTISYDANGNVTGSVWT